MTFAPLSYSRVQQGHLSEQISARFCHRNLAMATLLGVV